MFDAGHTHGPTPHFVSDCPLCDAAKAARNQAIEHLSDALYLLAGLRSHDEQPTVRLNLGPVGVTGDDAQRCHSIDLSAKQAEALADAIDSMSAYVSGESPIDRGLRDLAAGIEAAIPIDEDRMAQSTARFMGWLQGQTGEAIESGEWSAAAVAQNDPDTWDAVNDAFFELDLRAVTKQVLNDTTVDNLTVNRALDSWFGDIPDPELADLYGDEDGDA